jgi:transposase-like protein
VYSVCVAFGDTSIPAARIALDEFAGEWGDQYPAIIRLWENAWAELVPLLAYSPEIRKVIYSTNAIESVHARFGNQCGPEVISQTNKEP